MSQENIKQRDPIIDIMKGIAIYLVIVGHSWFPTGNGDAFVSQFHMALFIAISGYLFKEEKVKDIEGLRKYIVRKVKTLYMPYVLANSVFILLNNFFIRIHFLCTDPNLMDSFQPGIGPDKWLSLSEIVKQVFLCFTFLGFSPRFGGATWFLRCLFIVAVIHALITYLFSKKNINKVWYVVIATLFLCFKVIDDKYHIIPIGTINQFCMYYYAYVFGWFISREKKISNIKKPLWIIISICLFAILFYKADHNGIISMLSFIPNECLSAINSIVCFIMGWFMVYGFANIICGLRFAEILKWCGESTLEIMILHFFMFKLVTAVYVYIHHVPVYYLSATPVIRNPGMIFGLLYWVAGMALPTALHFLSYGKSGK